MLVGMYQEEHLFYLSRQAAIYYPDLWMGRDKEREVVE